MRPFGRLIPALEARRRLLHAVRPIARTESIRLSDALGRVAAQMYRAPHPIPPFARATWDGYAVRSRSTRVASHGTPARFCIVGEVFAESAYRSPLRADETVAIATGGAIPRGADSVVIFENVTVRGRMIEVPRPTHSGAFVARAGEDFPSGSVVVRRGERLSAATLGALGAIGRTRVSVYERPRVAIVPNGNELVSPGGRLGPGEIFEFNNLTLDAVVRNSGGVSIPRSPVPDSPRRIESAIRRALEASDLVLVTGGSSVGERDYLPSIFPRLGRLLFRGIAVRPGKPTLAVLVDRKLVVGMPGHPTSCLCNGFWLLLPVLRKLARLPGPGWIEEDVRLTESYELPTAGLSTVVPLQVSRGRRARPTFRDSSAITSLRDANAFALLPPRARSPARGDPLHAYRLLQPMVP